ncbi:hypothetical protein ABZZ44_33590, partial [Streptomyces sp. NPDC006460]|uniref:hypothetical protein n=1 Tax=Streptomyces sp. NPDC006460 TaxID=3154304 RepID=UPI0033B7F964
MGERSGPTTHRPKVKRRAGSSGSEANGASTRPRSGQVERDAQRPASSREAGAPTPARSAGVHFFAFSAVVSGLAIILLAIFASA